MKPGSPSGNGQWGAGRCRHEAVEYLLQEAYHGSHVTESWESRLGEPALGGEQGDKLRRNMMPRRKMLIWYLINQADGQRSSQCKV